MKKAIIALVFLSLFFIIPNGETMAQCAMCKSNLEMAREGGGTNVGNTLNNGIMYLLVLPYAIAAVFGYIYYQKYKSKKKAEQNS